MNEPNNFPLQIQILAAVVSKDDNQRLRRGVLQRYQQSLQYLTYYSGLFYV